MNRITTPYNEAKPELASYADHFNGAKESIAVEAGWSKAAGGAAGEQIGLDFDQR